MKRFLALGLSAGLLAVAFTAFSTAPVEACRQFRNQDNRAQSRQRRLERLERQLAQQQYQNQFGPAYANGYPYSPYPTNAGYYPPAGVDYASYYPPAGYQQPYFPGNQGLLDVGLNTGLGSGLMQGGLQGGLMQGLLSLF